MPAADILVQPERNLPAPDDDRMLDFARPPLGVFVHPAVDADSACPPIAATARALAADPTAPRPRLCLAEWVRLSGLDGYELDTPPPRDELGGSRPLFPGPVYARLTTYRALIAAPATPPDDRAYALFRAANCYAPSGINQCGGVDADKAERKGWYTRLKAEHPNTRWAQELRYWW